MNSIKRGDIVKFEVPLDQNSYIIGGYRPWLVVQNNVGNAHSDTTIVVPLTGHMKRLDLPTHVPIVWESIGPSTALCEQIRTVDIREHEWRKVTTLPPQIMSHIDQALMAALFSQGGLSGMAVDGEKPYFPIIEELLEYLNDKEDVRLQIVAYGQTPEGSETEIFYHNSNLRDLMAAAGMLQMVATRMEMEDDEDGAD